MVIQLPVKDMSIFYEVHFPEYEMIDCGDFRRLERFGEMILDRPCIKAHWEKKVSRNIWQSANYYFDESLGWVDKYCGKTTWEMRIYEKNVELKLSEKGQMGMFPEQLPNWLWLKKYTTRLKDFKVLNVFGYSGIATLFSAGTKGSSVEVTHIDGAKSAVNWTRRNIELSSMTNHTIRIIEEDALTFLNL